MVTANCYIISGPKPVTWSVYYQPITLCHKSYITCQSELMSSNHLQTEEESYTIEVPSGDSAVIIQAYTVFRLIMYTQGVSKLS